MHGTEYRNVSGQQCELLLVVFSALLNSSCCLVLCDGVHAAWHSTGEQIREKSYPLKVYLTFWQAHAEQWLQQPAQPLGVCCC